MSEVLTIENARKTGIPLPGKSTKAKPFVTTSTKTPTLSRKNSGKAMQRLAEEQFEEAFTCNQDPGGKADLEKALMAIAYLCDWSASGGNEGVDGIAVQGFVPLLKRAASHVHRFLYTQDDIRKCGGDLSILWEKDKTRADQN
jgi:hypothetical protein